MPKKKSAHVSRLQPSLDNVPPPEMKLQKKGARATPSATKPDGKGSDLFVVDNSEEQWKVARYLHDWCEIARAFDIATGYFEIGSLGKPAARKVRRAHILLKADEGLHDEQVARALHTGRATVERRHKRFVEEGLEGALNEKPRPGRERKLDGKAEALVVCGFAFDPHVSEEAKRYGKLAVLTARMNPDLAMGDELLKKTGAGNLFMVFGEPDVVVRRVGATRESPLQVEIKGVDVYDPTTGQVRSSSTDDIACWFIDTDYNGESFFVRHAYFTGAEEPYEKLKRALRAEVDEAAWSALYSTKSLPFDAPKTGKIAVKVINHYGDEVMKVYEV